MQQQLHCPSSLPCHRQPLLRRAPAQRRAGRTLVAPPRAAASFGEDPYKVLGLSRNADSKQVQKIYNIKYKELKNNPVELSRLEAAHSQIMMAGLSARLKGGGAVDKSVQFADRAVYFPWRPRFHKAERQTLLYAGAAQGLMLAWAVFLPTSAATQPLIYSSVASVFANAFKQYQLFPVSSAEADREKRQGLKNIARGAILAALATFLGCFLAFTLPDYVATTLNYQLPLFFFEMEATILNVGAILANYLVTAFIR